MLYPTGHYLMRSPRFPVERLYALNSEINNSDLIKIKDILKDSTFLDAIYFSSRQFYFVALDWLNNDEVALDIKDKVFLTLYKYYIRICTRSTPYGTFAGFSFGKVVLGNSKIDFENVVYEPKFRVDFQALLTLKNDVSSFDRNDILYKNNTIYSLGERLRYVDWNSDFEYQISDIKNSKLIQKILSIASEGIDANDILKGIQKDIPELADEEILKFIGLLISNKILVNNSPPYILSNKDPLFELINYLEKKNDNTVILKALYNFSKELADNIDIKKIEQYSRGISNLLAENDQLFQVDLKANYTNNQINDGVIQKLISDISDLKGLYSIKNSKKLNDFRINFSEKFEDREIPLAKAIDPELGVGYGSQVSGSIESTPLLDSIFLPKNEVNESLVVPPLLKIVLDKHSDCLDPLQKKSIIISQEDVEQVAKPYNSRNTPYSSYIAGALITPSLSDLDSGNFKFYTLSSLPIPHAARIFSRFTYYDQDVHLELKKLIMKSNEDYVDAEIAHNPEGKNSNILMRSNFFDYQIPYVSSYDPEINVIEINDIMVSIRQNEIVLRSKKLNKIIRPHQSSSYNHSLNTLPVFRFLCDMESNNTNVGYVWDWSFLQGNFYLPRVEYKNLILTEARWKFSKNKAYTIDLLKNEILKYNVPRYCNIKDADNVLELDLLNTASLQLILNMIQKTGVYLFENLNHSLYSQNANVGNYYNSEIIIPFYEKEQNIPFKAYLKNNHITSTGTVCRSFLPGDKWSFFKIYCSNSVGDRVLVRLKSIIDKFNKDGSELFFFFIRYGDPGHHIRFRVRDIDLSSLLLILKKSLKDLLDFELITSIKIDTYSRELERYGINSIELTEELFYKDSLCILNIISLLPKTNIEILRWKIAVISIDILLDDFGISVNQRVDLFKESYSIFAKEFIDRNDKIAFKNFRSEINTKLRKERPFLDSVLREKKYGELHRYVSFFNRRSFNTVHICNKIKSNFTNDREFLNILRSYIHMNLNRIFPTKARKHELIIYYFLYQSYTSIYKRDEKK